MNNEKLGAAPQMYAGGDAKQAIEFAWPYRTVGKLLLGLNKSLNLQVGRYEIN